jgi:hypothetical protein
MVYSVLCRCSILDVRRWEEFPPGRYTFSIFGPAPSVFPDLSVAIYRADTGIVLAARTTIACMCREVRAVWRTVQRPRFLDLYKDMEAFRAALRT